MSPEDLTPAEFGFRLAALEKRVDSLVEHLDRRFDGLSAQVKDLAFVRADVYAGDQRLTDAKIAALTEKGDSTHKLAMWAVALVSTVTIGAIVSAILAAGGVFG